MSLLVLSGLDESETPPRFLRKQRTRIVARRGGRKADRKEAAAAPTKARVTLAFIAFNKWFKR